jgi:hypothetical protein
MYYDVGPNLNMSTSSTYHLRWTRHKVTVISYQNKHIFQFLPKAGITSLEMASMYGYFNIL